MKITWGVDDGYVGGSRPQHTIIDDEDLDGYETEEDRERYINDYIQEEFEQSISWHITKREP